MAYRIAEIDVHKKMVAVAIANVEIAETWRFERRQIGTSPNQLRALAEWLVEREVDEVVMESTAQYWRAGLGRAGAVLAAAATAAARRPTARRGVASGAGAVERRAARPEAGFPRCRTVGETVGRAGTQAQFCAGCRCSGCGGRSRGGSTRSRATGCSSGNRLECLLRGSAHQGLQLWSRICSGPVGDACCAPSRMAKRIRRGLPRSAVARLHATPDRLPRCARGVLPTCIPSTGTCSR